MPYFTLRRMLAQCMMPRVSAEAYFDTVTGEPYRQALHSLILDEGIGGICVFTGDVHQTAQMIQELQYSAARGFHPPLFVSSDCEYGLAMRITGTTAFPHAMALGSANSSELTERVARAIALEAAALGIHWNFAPVADINSNPHNPVIGIRAFGETAETVSQHVVAYIRGTQQERVLATAKHFPGHGDTEIDSHHDLPILTCNRERLYATELRPFHAAIANGVASVMIGHLALPAIEPNPQLPASLSPTIITHVLRKELGFKGIIVTDGLDMQAITQYWTPEESAVRAFAAGADVLLLPPEPLRALNALEQAVEQGYISREKVRESATRIIQWKEWAGILSVTVQAPWDINNLHAHHLQRLRPRTPEISTPDHSLLALDAAQRALQWFGNDARIRPLNKFTYIAGFALVEEHNIASATAFFRYLAQTYHGNCDFAFVDKNIQAEDIEQMRQGTWYAELVLFAIFARPQQYAGSLTLDQQLINTIQCLSQDKPSVAILFGNPYIRKTIPVDAVLCTFSHNEPALGAAAVALTTG
ncbi:MAG: glycoside hydrolase family 3 N-terminal domain-containing protein [Bacteroidota bacterium]|nr:hypothetical protein [Candidatus Kapabacteria bacterium]MDW8220263.1 glycoside hydrolase family 3 N-terminal domain-containing protein [Bacteroidota bacterium]